MRRPKLRMIEKLLLAGILLIRPYIFSLEPGDYVVEAKKTKPQITIDGMFEEVAWKEAALVDKFTQREPHEGQPATERTEVRILYDEQNLYFGIVCLDSEPGKIVANEMRRDAELRNNDYFEIFIDTFNDHRNAFYFAVNPLGAQQDALQPVFPGEKRVLQGQGSSYNRAAGFDFNLAFGQSMKAGGFLAKTISPDWKGKDWAGYMSFIWESDFFTGDFSYTDIGENFNPEMGFVPRVDIRKFRANIGIGPRPKILGLRQVFLFNNLTYIENHAGQLESRNNLIGMFNLFQNGSTLFLAYIQNYEHLTEDFEIIEDVLIPTGRYQFNMFEIWYVSDMTKRIALRSDASYGHFYNGRLFSLRGSGFLKISKNFNLEFVYNRNQFDLPIKRGKFTTNIAGSRIIYSFTPNLFAKAYVQWNDTENRFISNFLIRWIYKPGANIYFIYNETRQLGSHGYLEDRALMLKVSFLFNY